MGKAGKALRQVLQAYKISQNKLAVVMGVGRSTMHYWYRGTSAPSADAVLEIRKGLRSINPSAADEFIPLYLDESEEDEESDRLRLYSKLIARIASRSTLDGSIKVEHFKVKVPVIGWLKTYERLIQGVVPKSVTISRHAERWFISFKIEVEPINTPKSVECVGVDLGITSLATLSTGDEFKGARSYKEYEKKLARLQYLLRHKIVGSSNYKKAQLKIARLHRKIANIRKDSCIGLTTYISKNHAVIGLEDLNVSGMMANRKLAKAIGDMGFYEFCRQLEYKCQLYGSKLVFVDRFYPSSKTCSHCGHVKASLSLSQRVFKCHECGFECDRDLNASINLAHGASLVVLACGLDNADVSRMKQEKNGNVC